MVQGDTVRQEDVDKDGDADDGVTGDEEERSPGIQEALEMQTGTNTRKRRKMDRKDGDRGTTVTYNNKVKPLTIKQMLDRMSVTGRKKSQMQEAQFNDIGSGALNIASDNNISSGGKLYKQIDAISDRKSKPGFKSKQIIPHYFVSRSVTTINQLKGEVIGVGSQLFGGNRDNISSTDSGSTILEVSNSRDRPENNKFPEEGPDPGLSTSNQTRG